jgi:ABC-type Fe3+/spermidine/putrescine transport system ATPase subunit
MFRAAAVPYVGRMILVNGLTKRYGRTVAVDHLSFEVTPGVVTGFLGPNGSGKSTTMRMIMGLDNPTSGWAKINGVTYRELRWPLREVGALLDAKAFHPARSAYDHLLFLARSNDIAPTRIDRGAHRRRPPEGRQVLARHGATPRDRRRPVGGPGRVALRRAHQRPRPRRDPLGPVPAARPGCRRADGLRVQPSDQRDVAHGRAPGGDRARHPHRRDIRQRVRLAGVARRRAASPRWTTSAP